MAGMFVVRKTQSKEKAYFDFTEYAFLLGI